MIKRMFRNFSLVFLAAFCLFIYGPGLFFSLNLRIAQYTGAPYALYLDNGAVVYGHLKSFDRNNIVVKNAISFQAITVGEQTTNNLTSQADNSLTKPGNFLAINRSHILYIEKIGKEAKILEALEKN